MNKLVCWTFGTILRIQQAADPGNDAYWLVLLHTMLSSMQGLLNASVYGMTEAVRDAWREELAQRCCRKGQGMQQMSELEMSSDMTTGPPVGSV